MPLIVISGIPCSGKTTIVCKLKDYFVKDHQKDVEIVSEENVLQKLGYEKNTLYSDSQQEKRLRENLKSEVIRLVRKDNVVILDGSNYIKGYRYELFCATKSIPTTQCTVYPIMNIQEACLFNENRLKNGTPSIYELVSKSKGYNKKIFEALVQRFEEPKGRDRWDRPLFMVQRDEELPLLEIWKALFDTAPPPPNMSTQNLPLSSTNFLYLLDSTTQTISKRIVEAKSLNPGSELVFQEYPGCLLEAEFMAEVESRRLLTLRRQFLNFAKMQYTNLDAEKIGRYFIQYLNKSLQD